MEDECRLPYPPWAGLMAIAMHHPVVDFSSPHGRTDSSDQPPAARVLVRRNWANHLGPDRPECVAGLRAHNHPPNPANNPSNVVCSILSRNIYIDLLKVRQFKMGHICIILHPKKSQYFLYHLSISIYFFHTKQCFYLPFMILNPSHLAKRFYKVILIHQRNVSSENLDLYQTRPQSQYVPSFIIIYLIGGCLVSE